MINRMIVSSKGQRFEVLGTGTVACGRGVIPGVVHVF
jgi:hypothetical protein